MATRALAAGALAVGVCAAAFGCGDDESPGPTTVTITEVGLAVRVPGELADLTHAMGESEEGQPAVSFSTQRLAEVGGPTCKAGASAAVSPYPIGQIVVSYETPRHVRKEARANPEENLGEFVARVGESYLYYIAPPVEPCAFGDREATALQRQLTATLKDALSTVRAAG